MISSFNLQRGGLLGLAVTCAALALPAAGLAHGKPASHPGKAVAGSKSKRCQHAKGKGALARCLAGAPVKVAPGTNQGASAPVDQNDGSTTSDDSQADDQNDDAVVTSDDDQGDSTVVDPTN